MGTIVTMRIARNARADTPEVAGALDRAFGWFHAVEAACSRFDPASELRALSRTTGVPVPVSDVLFNALEFACAVAEETDGAFDPAVGARMEALGFTRDYRTGADGASGTMAGGTYRDIRLDAAARTVTLARPIALDLGAVAKGLAVDLAARELAPFANYAVDAGGDLYLAGVNDDGDPWRVGIRHPRADAMMAELRVSDRAVCTSGDYERRSPLAAAHHILDGRPDAPSPAVASATVIAPTAMLADALSTAAFVLGLDEGLALVERAGAECLLVTADLRIAHTPEFGHVVLSHT